VCPAKCTQEYAIPYVLVVQDLGLADVSRVHRDHLNLSKGSVCAKMAG